MNNYQYTVEKIRKAYGLLLEAEKIAQEKDSEIALILRDIINELEPMTQ